MDSAVGASRDDPGRQVRLGAVRIGVRTTVLVCLGLGAYPLLPGHGRVDGGPYAATLVMASVGVLVVALLPWPRLLRSWAGIGCFYVWSIVDIALIAVAVRATGGPASPLFSTFALTTVFAAICYPLSGQILVLLLTIGCYGALHDVWRTDALAVFVVRVLLQVSIAVLAGFLSKVIVRQLAAVRQAREES